jgi:methyl-accepting chemotaxis protein
VIYSAKKSLAVRIVVSILPLVVVGVALITSVFIWRSQQSSVTNLKDENANLNTTLQAALYNAMLTNDAEGVTRALDKTGRIENIRQVYLSDETGKITKASNRSAAGSALEGAWLSRAKDSPLGVFELAETKDGSEYVKGIRAIAADQKCMQCHTQKEGEAIGYLGVDTWAQKDFKELRTSRNYSIILSLALVLVVGSAIVYQARNITRPLTVLTQVANSISVGDFSQPVEHRSADEVGVLANSFRQLKRYVEDVTKVAESLGNGDLAVQIEAKSNRDVLSLSVQRAVETLRGLVTEAQKLAGLAAEGNLGVRGESGRFSGGYREIIEGVNNTLDSVIHPVNEAAAVLQRVAEKDLSARVTGSYKGDFAKIALALNRAVKNLDETVNQVATMTSQVTSASSLISTGSYSLSQGASTQASSLEEVSSALQEMAATTKQNASNAIAAQGLSDSARKSAERGVDSMKRLEEAIGRIKLSSDKTAKIVKTIDEIAFQTNLLALNAAVEAARAGDAGKGFAVVAEEVRSLAMRSAEAAKNTANLIEESVKNAESGVTINSEVMKNLVEINDQVNRVSEVMAEIAAASEQQTHGVDQVNTAVEQVNQVTQQTASNAEESTSAAEELAAQAMEMKQVVSTFSLTDVNGVESQPVITKPKETAVGMPLSQKPRRLNGPLTERNASHRVLSAF